MGAPAHSRGHRALPALSGRAGLALCLLLGCVAMLLGTPAGAFAAEGASISGTVTAAAGLHEPLHGIEVNVYEAGSEVPFPVGSATTTVNGEYLVTGLPSGSYVVEFSAGFEGEGGNYVTQYYNDAATRADATSVSVTAGATKGNIDAAMEAGAEINGTVTSASASEDFLPLKGIEVAVYAGEEPVGFATTRTDGKYTVVGLRSGSYKVGFFAGYEGGGEEVAFEEGGGELGGGGLTQRDFITQFYNDKPTLAAAETVPVVQGGPAREGVNAEMQRGAEIEGTVTDASTKAPLRNALVLALGAGGVPLSDAFTNASGRYTIAALPSGSYTLEFRGSHYITQYYNNQPTLANATPLSVSAPDVTGGINAALVPLAPVNTAAPVASGTPSVGQTLSCAPGSWTGSPAPTFTYSWLRDGVPVPDAVANTYVVQSADEGNGLTCKVTATNKSGSAAAVSNTLTVPIPSPPPQVPTVTIDRSKIVVRGGVVQVPISCGAGANCTGWVELIERVTVKRRHGHHSHTSTKNVVVGKATYTLAGGHETTLVIKLSRSAADTLARHHSLDLTAHAVVGGGSPANRPLLLSLAVSRPAHKGRHRR
jgi:hypothetical protein